ncbi:MAG: ABC transporter ATP-binding protein, partial [Cycloclasticus sp.]
KRILENISLDIAAGKIIGLIGPNGAGKSTLIRVLAGLQHVDAGQMTINNHPIKNIPQLELAKKITYLPQTAQCHWPMTVERVVMLGRHPHEDIHRTDNVDMRAVEAAIKDADITHLIGRPVNELSGGERARVMLARALKLLAAQGKTIIVVLHELHLAMRYCDELIMLNDKQVVSKGVPSVVLTKENLHKVYGVDAIFGEHNGKKWVLPWLDNKKGET